MWLSLALFRKGGVMSETNPYFQLRGGVPQSGSDERPVTVVFVDLRGHARRRCSHQAPAACIPRCSPSALAVFRLTTRSPSPIELGDDDAQAAVRASIAATAIFIARESANACYERAQEQSQKQQ